MKCLNYIIGCILLCCGCTQDFLDVENVRYTTTETYYKTEAHALAAIYAAYDPLQWGNTKTFNFRWVYGDIVSDDAIKGGSNDADRPNWLKMAKFSANGSEGPIEGTWERLFVGIYRANVAIEKIPTIDALSAEKKTRLVGEAKFLRALYYHEAEKLWGGLPLLKKVTKSISEFNQARASEAETNAFIEEDLKAAIDVLPLKGTMPASELGRATKGAAQSLLARVYMYETPAKNQEAYDMADEVIKSGEYDLFDTVEDNFKTENENGIESIFEIQFTSKDNAGWGPGLPGIEGNAPDAGEGNVSQIFQRPRGPVFGGWGFNIPTQSLVDALGTDPRAGMTYIKRGELVGKGYDVKLEKSAEVTEEYYPIKYLVNKDEYSTYGGVKELNGEANDRYFRYADLLLLYAEAAAELNKDSEAQKYYNLVHKRSNSTDPDTSLSGQSLKDEIKLERRKELALEGFRFFDLIRWGKKYATDAMLKDEEAVNFDYDRHKYFKIPNSQITITGGAITQNP